MNNEHPGPQSISTALASMILINKICRKQLTYSARIPKGFQGMGTMDDCIIEQDPLFSMIYIVAPFIIKDIVSFHQDILNKGTSSPEVIIALQEIYKKSTENIMLFRKIQEVTTEQREDGYFKIDNGLSISQFYRPPLSDFIHNPSCQMYDNYALLKYCENVANIIESITTHNPERKKNPPPENFREWFKTDDHYTRFLNIMVDQKRYLNRKTQKWCDMRVNRKILSIVILKQLNESDYYNPDIEPKNEDYLRIANDVWGLKIKRKSATIRAIPRNFTPAAALPIFPEIS